MRKIMLALSLLSLLGAANASELHENEIVGELVKYTTAQGTILEVGDVISYTIPVKIEKYKDGITAFGGLNTGITAGEKSTGHTLGLNYTKYIKEGYFVQPSLVYIGTNTDSDDRHIIGLVNGGYTFNLENNVSVSPKAGIGYRYSTYTGGGSGRDSGIALNLGVDVGINKNWVIGVGYIYTKGGTDNHAGYTTLSLGYKF